MYTRMYPEPGGSRLNGVAVIAKTHTHTHTHTHTCIAPLVRSRLTKCTVRPYRISGSKSLCGI